MRRSPVTSLLLCALLGLSMGTSACFVDSEPEEENTGASGGTTGAETTGVGPGSGISASATASMSSTAPSTTASTTAPDTETETDSESETATATTGSTGNLGDTTGATEGSSDSSSGSSALSVDDLVVGDLIITEVMVNPNCDADSCEWIELFNATNLPIDLQGLRVGDRADAMTNSPDGLVTDSVIVEPRGLVVLVQQADAWPYAVPLGAEYGALVAFTNGDPEAAAIFNGDRELLDQTATFFSEAANAGRSFTLRPDFWDADANGASENWCLSDTVLESTGFSDDWGTPGSPEVTCADPSE